MSYYYVIITVRIGRLENKRPLIVIVAHEGCIIANCGAGIPSVWLFLTPHTGHVISRMSSGSFTTQVPTKRYCRHLLGIKDQKKLKVYNDLLGRLYIYHN